MSAKPIRSVITILMNLLIVLAVLLAARLIVSFFGSIAAQTWGEAIVRVTDFMVIPFGVDSIKTPYGGVFDVDAAITVVVFIAGEWILSIVRNRA